MPSADELEVYIRSNWHYLLIGLVIAYVVATKAQRAAQDVVKKVTDNSARAAVRKESQSLAMSPEDRIRAARERQFLLSKEAAERDAERAAEAERRKLEEQREKLAMRNTGEDGRSGRRLGSGDGAGADARLPSEHPPTVQPSPPAPEKPESGKPSEPQPQREEGPRLRLPKLPGGERQQYTPYSGPNDDKGYRPSRYQRNCGPKGG